MKVLQCFGMTVHSGPSALRIEGWDYHLSRCHKAVSIATSDVRPREREHSVC